MMSVKNEKNESSPRPLYSSCDLDGRSADRPVCVWSNKSIAIGRVGGGGRSALQRAGFVDDPSQLEPVADQPRET